MDRPPAPNLAALSVIGALLILIPLVDALTPTCSGKVPIASARAAAAWHG